MLAAGSKSSALVLVFLGWRIPLVRASAGFDLIFADEATPVGGAAPTNVAHRERSQASRLRCLGLIIALPLAFEIRNDPTRFWLAMVESG